METVKNSILIVDDEAMNIRALFEILSDEYTLHVEKNGSNCIKAAQQFLPDLILLDVMMPEMDGFDVIETLKSDKATKNIPIIFVTGMVDPDDETKGFSLGAVDYIKKPFSEQVIKMRVRHQMQIINQLRKIETLREAEMIEQKRQEQENLNKRIQLVLDSSPMSVELYSDNRELLDINTGTLRMHGVRDKKEFLDIYRKNPEAFSPEFQENGLLSKAYKEELFEKAFKWKHVQFDWINCTVDGETFPTEITLAYIEASSAAFYVAYVHDLRKLKKLENERFEALEEAGRAKSRFLARMSHEIRTPISAVLGISEILLREKKVPPDLDEAVTKIYDSSKTLLSIVNNILDFSKIETGNMTLVNKEYELASLLSDLTGLCIVFIKNKNVTLKVHVDENLPVNLVGDVTRVKEIIDNLLSNSFKYTKSGSVVMSLSREDIDNDSLMLVINIKDTGVGMTLEQVEAIKDEYVRFSDDDNSYVNGAGLGIPIVYSLVQMMDATIDYDSEVGEGTTVTIKIPQKISGSELLGSEAARILENFEKRSSIHKDELEFVPEQMPYGRVLVVDDVDTNLYVAEAMLKSFGLSVDMCESGLGAIEKVENGEIYDIIFMDQMMPDMDGVQATIKLREMGYYNPIVALTANAVKGQANAFANSGLSGFMTKPIDINILNSFLVKYVKNKEKPQ